MPKWLTCKINKGMFSDEFNVIVTTLNGEDVSVFVPKDFTDEGNRRVRVQVIEAGKRAVAILPDEHQSTVNVDPAQLQPV